MKKYLIVIFATALISTNILLLFAFYSEDTSDEEYKARFQQDYSIYTIELPDTLYFAGERVPLEFFDVRESLERELLINTYWQSQTILFIKKANRYFPLIEPILKSQSVPDDFKYLPLAESGFSYLVSPAGAEGYWQFLDATAKENGLEVNTEIDERYHIEKATTAACNFLKGSRELFGSWTMAAAAFNTGRTNLKKQINFQKTDNYYDIRLNSETARYIYRILALKILLTTPAKYGFKIRKKDLYQPTSVKLVAVDSSISNLSNFALQNGTSYKMLRFLNPWIMSDKISNTKNKMYSIKIPDGNIRTCFNH